jgi:hypothetical protein
VKLTGTSQRIRGAIDARIAEEQAKQRTTPSVPPRSGAARTRSTSRNLSPSKRTAKSKDADSKAAPTGKGPDPSEFDPEFVIGEEDEQPSRSGTPKPKEKAPAAEGAADEGSDEKKESEAQTTGEDKPDTADTTEKAEKAPEVPAEVKTRLRRLDKLEPKYFGVYAVLAAGVVLTFYQNCCARTASHTPALAPSKPLNHLCANTLPSHPLSMLLPLSSTSAS